MLFVGVGFGYLDRGEALDLGGQQEQLAEMADVTDLGTETVSGYECDKNRYDFHDKSKGTMVQCYSHELEFPIRIEYEGPEGKVNEDFRDIEPGGLSDSLFEVPADYQQITMPAMPETTQ